MTIQASPTDKEPWLGVILSNIFPGVGQIYAGKIIKGLILFFVALTLLGLGGWLILSPTSSVWLGFQVLIAYFIFFIFNLFDAYRCAKKNNNRDFEALRHGDKDPWLSVFLSRIIPGLGHAYQKQWAFALLFFIIIIGINLLTNVFPIVYPVAMGLSYFCFYHAYISSPTRRAKSQRLILLICLILLIFELFSIVFAFYLRGFVVETRYIPSSAMNSTLQINDRLIVDKLGYQFSSPQRRDIIIFRATPALQQQNFHDAFIKRIIGLPGETIEIKQGKVYIDGQSLQEDYIAERPNYEYKLTKIPPKSYFVLGDNRNNSYDSHYWGFVPEDYIIGRATKIWWPLQRSGMIN